MRFSFSQRRPRIPPIGGHAIHPLRPPFARQTSAALCSTVVARPEHTGSEIETSTLTGGFTMNTIARRIGRYVALPVVSAGIIGGAALGLAGMANAATPSYNPEPRPGIVAVPQTKAKPAAEAHPGAWWHRHHPSLLDPSTSWQFVAPFA
jgi:hypothetical protein